MDKQQKIDKEKFKQIFKDHFAKFQKQNSRYNNDYYTEVIEKMIGCAEKDSGYAKYRCMNCGEERVVPFSCKSSFCLSCARIKLEKWLAKVEDNSHLHIMMTAGGLDREDNWHDIDYVPFDYLHKKWQYFLFKMMRQEFGKIVNEICRQSPDSIIPHN